MTESADHEFGTGTDTIARPEVSDDSVLADLIAEANSEEDGIEWYPVPNRPDISLGFSTAIDYDVLKVWFKRATDRKKKELKMPLLASIVLSNQTRGVKVKGNVVAKDGEDLLLTDEALWSIFKADNLWGALRAIYRSEGHVIAACQKIIEDAGYGETDMEADDDPLD